MVVLWSTDGGSTDYWAPWQRVVEGAAATKLTTSTVAMVRRLASALEIPTAGTAEEVWQLLDVKLSERGLRDYASGSLYCCGWCYPVPGGCGRHLPRCSAKGQMFQTKRKCVWRQVWKGTQRSCCSSPYNCRCKNQAHRRVSLERTGEDQAGVVGQDKQGRSVVAN